MEDGLQSDVGPWARCPEWVIYSGVSSNALHLFLVLERHAHNDKRTCFPGRPRLAELMNASESTVKRALNELLMIGAVVRQERFGEDGRQRSNLYVVRLADPGMTTLTEGGEGVTGEPGEGVTRGPHNESQIEREKEPSTSADDEVRPEVAELCEHLASRIEEYRGKRPRITAGWYKDMRLLVDRGDPSWATPDALGPEKVRNLMDYIFDHAEPSASGFCWAQQVQAPSGLRRKYDKIRVWALQHYKTNQAQEPEVEKDPWMNRSRSAS